MSIGSFAKIFSHSVHCLFILFRVSFAVQKLLSLIKSHLFIFVFTVLTLRGGSEMLLLFMSESVWPVFPSRSLIVSGLISRSLIHLEFIFVYGVRECGFSMWLSSFPSCPFFIVYPCLLCHRLVGCRCLGLILGFLSCSTNLYFCLCASTIRF